MIRLKILFSFFVSILLPSSFFSQTLTLLHQEGNSNLRGLSVVNENTFWVSGSKGTIGRSTDGGKSWKWMMPDGFSEREFRDIEAFDSLTAIALCIASPGVLIKTSDGGKTWRKVYENSHPDIFLDAMAFYGSKGVCIGDPIKNKIVILETKDQGEHWKEVDEKKRPKADSGEAFFAASGTNIKWMDKNSYAFVSGGIKSKFYNKKHNCILPIAQGNSSSGANGFDFFKNKIIVCGGDFAKDSVRKGTLAVSENGGKKFERSTEFSGYRSCVSFADIKNILACGTSGLDLSKDGGINFEKISEESYNTCEKLNANSWILVGRKGRIAILRIQ